MRLTPDQIYGYEHDNRGGYGLWVYGDGHAIGSGNGDGSASGNGMGNGAYYGNGNGFPLDITEVT